MEAIQGVPLNYPSQVLKGGRRVLAAAAVALGAVLVLAVGPAAAEGGTGTSPAATAPVGDDGAWSYFSDPRAVKVTNPRPLLYTGWVTRLGSIVAATYDPATSRVETMVLFDRLQNDDHNNPSVLALPDGRVTYFFSGHNAPYMYYRTTTRAGDIRSFGPLRALPVHPSGDRLYTYSNPILLPDEHNRLYMFWRSQYTHQAFATSDDLGEHWSPARVLIEEPGQRPYVKYDASADTIAMAFTRSHPDESPTGIYYMSYWKGAFFRADGTAIGGVDDLPIAPSQADVVVPTPANGSAWIMDVALGSDGRPVIVYVTTGAAHAYHYVRWNGLRWADTLLADAGPSIASDGREPSYSGGVVLDHGDPSVVYLSRRVDTLNRIEKMQTADGGATFTTSPVEQNLAVDNLRPVVPRGTTSGDPVRALWMSGTYRYFTDFLTSVVGAPALPPTRERTAIRAAPVPAQVAEGTVTTLRARLFSPDSFRAAADVEVTLFGRRAGGVAWSRLDSQRTDQTGLVSFRHVVRRSEELLMDWPGDDRWTPVSTAPLRIAAIAG